jgi:hypothetical protein
MRVPMVREPHFPRSDEQTMSAQSAQDIIQICEQEFPKHWNDCSGFVAAVAQKCGVLITGNANEVVENYLSGRANFMLCYEADALRQAKAGNFVIAGLADRPNGHIVVVVDHPLHHGHVYAYWGRLHRPKGSNINVGQLSFGRGGITQAWKSTALPNVKFGWIKPSSFLTRQNRPKDPHYHL